MKKYCKNKDIDKEVSKLIKLGWIYTKGNKHGGLQAPSGERLTVSVTPSDRRALNNFRRDVCRVNTMVLNNVS